MSRIFISYRREDTAGHAISIRDRLADRFGTDQIFMDIDDIEPGEDFVAVINEKVSACDVLLVLIGRNWLTCKDESGHRRLDNHDDFVRLEVATALDRKIRVVPVLVGGARPPKSDELPPELVSLCRRNAVALRDAGFRQDINRLIEGIDKVINVSGTSARHTGQLSDSSRIVDDSDSNSLDSEAAGTEPHLYGDAVMVPQMSDSKAEGAEITVGQGRVFRDHSKPVKIVTFSPDSTIVASAGGGSWLGGGDTAIRLWRVSDGRLLRKLTGHNRTVNKIVFSPGGEFLASCCSKTTFLWRMPDGKCLSTLGGGAHDLAFSIDGTRLAALCRKFHSLRELWDGAESEHHLWSIPDGKDIGYNTLDKLSQKADFAWDGVSPDGRMTVAVETVKIEEDEYQAIVLRSISDSAIIREIKDKDLEPMNNAVFSADGCLLVSSHTFRPVITLWRVSDGKHLAEIQWQDQVPEKASTYH
jgi:WD40 repeat protein